MKKTLRLTSEEKNFFRRVYQAGLANPFSDERAEFDQKIAGMFPDIPRTEVITKAITEVRTRIAGLEKKGTADINRFTGTDHQTIKAAFLFDIFHLFLEKFDRLIFDQLKSSENSLTVPFADEALLIFRKRGFDHTEALHFFSLCYQLRRAFYFIDRSLVGRSASMKKLREDLWNDVFTCDLNLYNHFLWNRMEDFSTLLLGETGTGKGAAAMAIGRSGFIPFDEKKRCFTENFTRTFVSLNLSQFSENLLESELFGHKKGAFTGAVEDHKGIFSRCSTHGAIFLDEIGEVSAPVQIKLLKVLEERVFCPVGSHDEYRFKGRIIAATNRPVGAIQNKTLLRDDFLYRLCSDIITVPPLRQRIQEDPGELDDLLNFTIEKITGIPSPDLAKLTKRSIHEQLGKQYSWPGNVRELGQCVRRILLKRNYQGFFPIESASTTSELVKKMDKGKLDAKNLVKEYCRLLYEQFQTYGEVARRIGLDRRTVKKYIEEVYNRD